MSFTYDLATDIGKVRLYLGDITSGAGPRPDGTNFSDEEITLLLEQEGDSVMRTVAACCEILANAWASVASDIAVGSRRESNQQATLFANRAEKLRAQHGGAVTVFVSGFKRNDGYALNATANGAGNA